MLSQVSMILSATVLLITAEPLGATQNISDDEMDCYLEARLTTTAELIDSALRNMAKDFKKQQKRINCSMRQKDCPEICSRTSDSQPINCKMCQTECSGSDSSTYDVKPIDCSDVYLYGNHTNGQYIIWPKSWITNKPLLVYCDMETDGGGWTVIQRRGNFGNRNDSFHREWSEYKIGFGNIEEDFWIGNDNLFALTNQRSYQIRFDLWTWGDNFKYAVYKEFRVEHESRYYKLHVNGYSGTAGDSFSYHDGMQFTTKDRDHDTYRLNCAIGSSGGWWFKDCFRANLNGLYTDMGTSDSKFVSWYSLNSNYAPLKATNMKIRPLVS